MVADFDLHVHVEGQEKGADDRREAIDDDQVHVVYAETVGQPYAVAHKTHE